MKSLLKLIATSLTAAVLLSAIAKTPRIHAQEPVAQQAVMPVVISATVHPYKVIDMGKVAVGGNLTSAQTLEAILNEFGAQGWRVVTTSGSFVILTQ